MNRFRRCRIRSEESGWRLRDENRNKGFIPPAVEYRRPITPAALPPLSSGAAMGQFFGGFFLGAALSGVVWLVALKLIGSAEFLVQGLRLLLVAKLALGIGLLFVRRRRLIGAGVLVSIALGILIFGGAVVYLLVTCKPV